MENVSFIVAFFAGMALFFSPCVLPLIPVYISYLTGISFQNVSGELNAEEKRRIRFVTVLHSLAFIAGFTIVFVLLGASVTLLGRFLAGHQGLIKRIGGALIIFFALVITGVIKVPFLAKEKKISYRKQGISIFGSALVGAAFAAAWTPCVGPILGSILVYASSTASIQRGIALLGIFSLGLGLPFFLSALAINSLLSFIKKIGRYMRIITIVFGVLLAIFGAVLLMGGNAGAEEVQIAKAADFELQDINGKNFRLSDYAGNVIVLNFFATWCPPCRTEMPDFNRIASEYAADVTVIAINVGNEPVSKVRDFVSANGLTFTVAMDDGNVSSLYGPIRSIPVTYFINRDFNIAKKYIGSRPGEVFVKDVESLK